MLGWYFTIMTIYEIYRLQLGSQILYVNLIIDLIILELVDRLKTQLMPGRCVWHACLVHVVVVRHERMELYENIRFWLSYID